MLHALVHNAVPLAVSVKKSCGGFWIILHALISYRINFMRIVLGAWNILFMFLIGEVGLLPESHRRSIIRVGFAVRGHQAWLDGLVLVWNRFMQFRVT